MPALLSSPTLKVRGVRSGVLYIGGSTKSGKLYTFVLQATHWTNPIVVSGSSHHRIPWAWFQQWQPFGWFTHLAHHRPIYLKKPKKQDKYWTSPATMKSCGNPELACAWGSSERASIAVSFVRGFPQRTPQILPAIPVSVCSCANKCNCPIEQTAGARIHMDQSMCDCDTMNSWSWMIDRELPAMSTPLFLFWEPTPDNGWSQWPGWCHAALGPWPNQILALVDLSSHDGFSSRWWRTTKRVQFKVMKNHKTTGLHDYIILFSNRPYPGSTTQHWHQVRCPRSCLPGCAVEPRSPGHWLKKEGLRYITRKLNNLVKYDQHGQHDQTKKDSS